MITNINEFRQTLNEDLYFPMPVKTEDMVPIQQGSTLGSQEFNDILFSQMQMIGREDLDEEQIENLVDNLDKQNLRPWDLYNKLLGYIEPHSKKEFRKLYDNTFKKLYIPFDQVMANIPQGDKFDPISHK